MKKNLYPEKSAVKVFTHKYAIWGRLYLYRLSAKVSQAAEWLPTKPVAIATK